MLNNPASRPVSRWLSLTSKRHPSDGPFFSGEMVPSIVAEDGIALRVYCWLAGVPQIHFGRADGVERTL